MPMIMRNVLAEGNPFVENTSWPRLILPTDALASLRCDPREAAAEQQVRFRMHSSDAVVVLVLVVVCVVYGVVFCFCCCLWWCFFVLVVAVYGVFVVCCCL